MAVRWFPMSTQFLADPKIEALGDKHGPGGPLTFVALLGRAKIAAEGGRVTCSYRTLAHEVFVDRADIACILEDAAETGLLSVERQDDRGATVKILAFSRWQDRGKKAEQRGVEKPTPEANVPTCPDLSREVPTDREERKKDKQTNRTEKVGKADAPLSWLLADLIEGNGASRPRIGKKWADAERLMLERDGRDRTQAEKLLRWCQNDEFWRGNILSMPKFREKYDQLLLQAQRKSKQAAPGMSQAERRAAEIHAKRERRAAA